MNDQDFKHSIGKINAGDIEGLREIYEAYVTFIYSVVLSTLHSKEDAEDVTSDFFIKLWDIACTWHDGSGHRAWMASIARHMAIDYLRKHGRECLAFEADEQENPAEDALSNEQIADSPEDAIIGEISMKEAMATLASDEAQILDLKFVACLTFREIADIMGAPQGTVAWKYQNALKKLRRGYYGQQ